MSFIAHLDMDAFYASVELLRYPQLRGAPLVIGGPRRESAGGSGSGIGKLRGYAGRGVITTATYEARALGVHSGMGLMKAAKLAPDALLLPADFDEYRRYSRMFKAAVRALAPEIEDRGIDEIYIDLTALVAQAPSDSPLDPWARARETAQRLQQAVYDATGLSCSIGVSPNKLLSKLASEFDKPAGITVLRDTDVESRVWPLAARELNGIGPKAAVRLEALGIRTVGDLARAQLSQLMAQFGASYGRWMHDAALGLDTRPVVTDSEPKSISRETTFEQDLHPVLDRSQLSEIFTGLCARVAADLERKGYAGRKIGLKLRFDNFATVTRDCTLESATRDAGVIRSAAGACLKRVPLDRRIRLLGVRVGELQKWGAGSSSPPGSTDRMFENEG